MPSIALLQLKDGQATPVNHDFTPQSSQIGDQPAVWYNREANTPLGYRRVTLSVKAVTNGVSKVRVVIADPILVNPSSACCIDKSTPQVSYTDFFDATFSVPFQSSAANRADILAYAKNMLASDFISQAVLKLEPTY